MAKSNVSAVKKPRPDFPRFPHASGRWAKNVGGKLRYFGKTADDTKGKRALDKWLEQNDELLAGRVLRANGVGLTIKVLVNGYLTSQFRKLQRGELSPRSFADCKGSTSPIRRR